jgi:hypothetical protein
MAKEQRTAGKGRMTEKENRIKKELAVLHN